MLENKYLVVSPYLTDINRLNALSSGYNYGSTDFSDDHHLQKLDLFIKNLENPDSYNHLSRMRNIEYPDLKRRDVRGFKSPMSDLSLKETYRHNMAIEEKYRNGLTSVSDIRKICDPLTKYWRSSSRGYELKLMDLFNNLDSEGLNRRSIKPII